MTKKLKTLVYKSKAEFTADLDLIWNNCLKYNADIAHPLRRNANSMRKEAEKLIPLIPDIVIRPRAEVEAEERRRQNGGEEEESDEEPIMSSRGRKAPGKTGTKSAANKASKSVPGREETPSEQKPVLHLNGLLGEGQEFGREGSSNDFATPPLAGRQETPGAAGGARDQSHADAMDIDGPSINGLTLALAVEDLQEDEETKAWKQLTKKDRALAARDRHKLFKGDKLNPDEPALLRTKAGMRRFTRQQNQAQLGGAANTAGDDEKPVVQAGETLAEGMEGDHERYLPDYYDSLSAIPDIAEHLRWIEDDKGQVIDQTPEEYLRMLPKGYFTAPQSTLTSRIEANMRQMQETRKICSKIGVVKQMQLQSQVSLSYLVEMYLTGHRCTTISFRSINRNLSLRRMWKDTSFPTMVRSWPRGYAELHFNDQSANSVIMQGSKNCSLLLLMSSPTLLATTLTKSFAHSMYTTMRLWFLLPVSQLSLAINGRSDSQMKKSCFIV